MAGRGVPWVVVQVTVFAAYAAVLFITGDGWGLATGVGGLVVAVLGAVLALWSMAALGRNLSPFPSPVVGATLVDHGPYGLARHPIYGGIVLGGGGLALADGNGWALALVAILTGFFWFKSRYEERRLSAELPGYEDYVARVRRRLIPYLL